MNNNNLKLFSKCYVMAHDRLNEEEKKLLFDFINEANNESLYNLLVTGKPEKVSEGQLKNIEENIEYLFINEMLESKYYFNVGNKTYQVADPVVKAFENIAKKITPKTGMKIRGVELPFLKTHNPQQLARNTLHLLNAAALIGTTTALTLILYAAFLVGKDIFGKAERACGDFQGRNRELCIEKYRLESVKQQIATLKQGVSACAKTKKPHECKIKIEARAAALQRQATKHEMKIKKLSK